jgi:hypothetical protein
MSAGDSQIFSRRERSAGTSGPAGFLVADAGEKFPVSEYQSGAGSSARGFCAFPAAFKSFQIH